VRALGFSGIFTRFRKNSPHDTPRADAERLRAVLADHGVRLFQVTGYWQNLITPDERVRRESVSTLRAALRLAGWMGARGIDTGPGSMSSRGPWYPHPDNWTASARHQLVKSLKECVSAAEDAGVFLSLEGHVYATLSSAAVTREVLDEVGSPWVRSDYDSANWQSPETINDTAAALNRDFDTLGDYIISCHVKDYWIDARLGVHYGCAGQGEVDFATLFRRLEALSPDYPAICEGNTTEELPQVSALFHRTAEALGIPVLEA
jgi:sugar phosphate isomerase/epimerase